MISYLCDSSFEGLLTAIYFAYKETNECRVLSGNTYQNTLDETLVEVNTDYDIYSKMETYISERCTVDSLMCMYKAYLGEDSGIADSIFRFFKIAMQKKEETMFMHSHPDVMPVLNIWR